MEFINNKKIARYSRESPAQQKSRRNPRRRVAETRAAHVSGSPAGLSVCWRVRAIRGQPPSASAAALTLFLSPPSKLGQRLLITVWGASVPGSSARLRPPASQCRRDAPPDHRALCAPRAFLSFFHTTPSPFVHRRNQKLRASVSKFDLTPRVTESRPSTGTISSLRELFPFLVPVPVHRRRACGPADAEAQ